MRRGLWVLIPGLLLTGSACGRGGSEAEPAPSPAQSPAHVEVKSNYALPLEIYVVGSGINHRLGIVHPGMTADFVVPPTMTGNSSVEFQARPTEPGRQQFRSGPLLIAAGRTVDFVITPQLFNSTVTLRP